MNKNDMQRKELLERLLVRREVYLLEIEMKKSEALRSYRDLVDHYDRSKEDVQILKDELGKYDED